MLRTLTIVGIAVLLLLGTGGTMLYLAYGLAKGPPSHARIAGLDDSTTIRVLPSGAAAIEAPSRAAAYTALGYLHAQEHGWTMTILERTAHGRLAALFGDRLLPLDRLAVQLGLGRLAQIAYAGLPEDDKAMLLAYVQGVNAVFGESSVEASPEFSLMNVAPERWEPWYPLVVERLYAWLATTQPHSDSLATASDDVRAFFESDRLLDRWLHLHGFERSMAWTRTDSAGTRLTQRHVYGASAVSIYQEAELSVSGVGSFIGASLVGTPFFPAGRSEAVAWSILLSSDVSLSRTIRDTTSLNVVYERLEALDGREQLYRFHRDRGELFFPIPGPSSVRLDTTAADSLSRSAFVVDGWSITWEGLNAATDASAWLNLPFDSGASFGLIRGDGLLLRPDGSSTVIGTPEVAVRYRRGVAVGNDAWASLAAERLDSLDDQATSSSTDPTALNDMQSAWAGRIAPPLAEAAMSVPDQPALVTEALAYLRNWDYAFDRASIAASIFDTWSRAYFDSLGVLPEATVADSSLGLGLVRYELLVTAVAHLAERFGDDPSQWRWEDVQPHRFHYPVWSADSLLAASRRTAGSRYAPITMPGNGHVTTLYHGPSAIFEGLDAPSTWEGWISTSDWEAFHFRRRRFEANRFFGRYLVSDRLPDALMLPSDGDERYRTILLPQ